MQIELSKTHNLDRSIMSKHTRISSNTTTPTPHGKTMTGWLEKLPYGVLFRAAHERFVFGGSEPNDRLALSNDRRRFVL